MATKVQPQKKVDVPPTGNRNADPITNEAGSHPIETGIGAAAIGAAAGMAAGAVGGPMAAAIGTAVGAVAGGYAGKGLGEFIDPTTEDNWLCDHFESAPYVDEGDTFEDFHPAYRFGAVAEAKYGDAGIDLMDEQFQREWEASKDNKMPWSKAKGAVKDAYERTIALRRARACACATKCDEVLED